MLFSRELTKFDQIMVLAREGLSNQSGDMVPVTTRKSSTDLGISNSFPLKVVRNPCEHARQSVIFDEGLLAAIVELRVGVYDRDLVSVSLDGGI